MKRQELLPSLNTEMQPSPSKQLKINQYLRALPPPRELDDDCFIVEPVDLSNKSLNEPADSKVIDAATPKRRPKINDDDDDDEPLARPQANKIPADLIGNQNMNEQADSKVVDAATPKRHPKINDDDDDDNLHALPQANKMLQPPEIQLQGKRSASTSKAKPKHKRPKASTPTASVKITHSIHNVKVY